MLIPFVKKKIGSAYLVWLENSNTYLQLEEPAWFVFHQLTKRCKVTTTTKAVALRYGWTEDQCRTFTTDIYARIKELNQPETAQNQKRAIPDALNKQPFVSYAVHHYRLGDHPVTFSSETPLFGDYLHPLICHLETEVPTASAPHFELFGWENQIVFRFNGIVQGVWSYHETHLVKGLIFMFLVNVMHDKEDADWLMTIHASAVTNGKKSILFSAPPGHGKTTLAALLQTRGYRLISDDFVPIDRELFQAYPFPIAMSVKEGSVDLLSNHFPKLSEKRLNILAPDKRVRYLASDQQQEIHKMIFPVHEIVFVHYDKAVDFAWEKLDPALAAKKLFDQTWVTPVPGNAALLFERIPQIAFYQLTYYNNQKALDAISNLFGHDQQ